MARLTVLDDDDLGPLTWNEDDLAWQGHVTVGQAKAALTIDTGLNDPNEAEQRAAVESARSLLPRVLPAMPGLLRSAAEQVATDVEGQGKLSIGEFTQSLRLLEVSLHESGELHYDCSEFFGAGAVMTVFFEADLSFGGAEIDHPVEADEEE